MMRALASARGSVVGLIVGMGTVAAVNFLAPSVSFLWHNVIGAGVVVLVGLALSVTDTRSRTRAQVRA